MTSGIRDHLKWLVVNSIGQAASPTREEYSLLESKGFLADDKIWRTVSFWNRNPGWLDLLGEKKFEAWLDPDKPNHLNAAFGYLQSVLPSRKERIVPLFESKVGLNANWNMWVGRAISNLGTSWDVATVRLLAKILGDKHADLDSENGFAWFAFLDLCKFNPQAACGLLPIILDRYTDRWPVDTAVDIEERKNLLPTGYTFSECLKLLAAKASKSFMDAVMPWTILRMKATCSELDPQLYKTRYVIWRDQELHDVTTTDLLGGILLATSTLAREFPEDLKDVAAEIIRTELAPLHCVLSAAYAANPGVFASVAATYLSEDSRRLRLGTVSDTHWYSKQLITACSPHWSSQEAEKVESAILLLVELNKPRSVEELKWMGTERLQLLISMASGKLTPNGRKVLGELQRKFPKYVLPERDSVRVGWVGPPIAENRLDKLTDSGWVGAMKAYTGEESLERRAFSFRGGRPELANALEQRAEKNPARFLKLAEERMDSTIHPDYCKSIIRGLAKGKAPIDRLVAVAEKFVPQLPQEDLHWMASSISNYPPNEVPERFVKLIREWALKSSDPKPDEKPRFQSEHARKMHRELLSEGINNTRGSSLWNLGRIYLMSAPPRYDDFFAVAEEVSQDPALSVRAVCLKFLAYVIPVDPPRGYAIFTKLTDGHPELLRESEGQECIYRCLHRNAGDVLPAIELLLADGDVEYHEAGARLACLAAFETEKAAHLRDQVLTGGVEMRRGAATVYAANIADPRVGAECKTRLDVFFNDSDESVRSKATDFLRKLDADALVALDEFIIRWAGSRSVAEGASDISYALNKFPVANPRLTLAVVDRILDALGSKLIDISNRLGVVPHNLTPALLNVYRNEIDPGMRKKALDLFEKLEALGAPEVAVAYESFDRG